MTEEEARERVIRAMCPDRVCQTCGEPSRRIVENLGETPGRSNSWNRAGTNSGGTVPLAVQERPRTTNHLTLGWTDCGHDDWRPGVWLDPFG